MKVAASTKRMADSYSRIGEDDLPRGRGLMAFFALCFMAIGAIGGFMVSEFYDNDFVPCDKGQVYVVDSEECVGENDHGGHGG